jgi:arylsulfatase A-like enzyme
MAQPSSARPSRSSAWRAGAWPALALLGLVLPLAFLPQIEDYLYYLRRAELLPAYGTAWLFLAALAVPAWLLLVVLLKTFDRYRRLGLLRDVVTTVLIGSAAAGAVGALLYCMLMWLQSFGSLSHWSFTRELLWPSLAVGSAVACTRRGRAFAEAARPIAWASTVVGACTTLTLPFFSWDLSAPPELSIAASSTNPPPHIVLLTIDALSAEHMSLYGGARPTTPMLNAFAAQATTFEHSYANANFTTPGVASILTGTRPWTHRAPQLPSWPEIEARRASLPALLHQAGYQTAYVSTNAVAGAAKNGLNSYFDFASRDRIRDVSLCTDGLSALFKYACPVAALPLFNQLSTWTDQARGGRDSSHYDPKLAIEPALAWLARTDKSKPVFLWVHLFPPHSPYAAPSPWLGAFDASADARNIPDSEPNWGYELGSATDARVQVLAARYDESVAYADFYAGQFLQRALQELGENTVVVVTADHGESFRHGYGAHTGPGMFDEIIRVPLIIKLPWQNQAVRSDPLAEQVDIAPTVAEIAGLNAPAVWEGRSLLAAWAAPQQQSALAPKDVFSMNFEQNPRFSVLANGVVAVIDGHWKLVHYLGRLHYPQMPSPSDALFDLSVDPGESRNVAAAQPQLVRSLRALIDTQLSQHGGERRPGGSAPLDTLGRAGTDPGSLRATRDAAGQGF